MVCERQFGTTSIDHATGIVTNDSGIYLAGFTSGTFMGQTSAGREDAFLKFDGSGNMIWLKQFGTDANDYVCGVAVDSS